jgi:hypothetical protein
MGSRRRLSPHTDEGRAMKVDVRPAEVTEEDYEFEVRLHADGSLDIVVDDTIETFSIALTKEEAERLRDMLAP